MMDSKDSNGFHSFLAYKISINPKYNGHDYHTIHLRDKSDIN